METVEAILIRGEKVFNDVDTYKHVDEEIFKLLADDLIRSIDRCPAELSERFRILIIDLIAAGFLDQADQYNEQLPNRDTFWFHRTAMFASWQNRHMEMAIEAGRKALQIGSSDSELLAVTQKDLARALYENNAVDEARRWIAIAEETAQTFQVQFLINVHAQTIRGANHSFLEEVLKHPRSRFKARYRISILYMTIEHELRNGDPVSCRECGHEAMDIVTNAGLQWNKFSVGMSVAKLYRATGDQEKAVELLTGLPQFRVGAFSSEVSIASELGTCFLHLGQFEAAHEQLMIGINGLIRRGGDQGHANLLTIRAGIWIYEQKFSFAVTAFETIFDLHPTTLALAVRSILALIEGDQESAENYCQRACEHWIAAPSPFARAIAYGLRGVVTNDPESLHKGKTESMTTSQNIIVFIQACEWLMNPSSDNELDFESESGRPIFGTVAGTALAGLVRHRTENPVAHSRINVIEEGLYMVDGQSVDLRKRKTLFRILEILKSAPEEDHSVIDLFVSAWETDVLPTTYTKRVYFAVYELRRLGFRDYIQNTDEGYLWEYRASEA